MNVRVPYPDARKCIHVYGLALDVQNEILDLMTELMTNMRVTEKLYMYPFQKGIIQLNLALKMLYEDLKSRFEITHILTYRLNQDVLENFFLIVGNLNIACDQTFLGSRREYYQNTNTLVDDTPDFELNNKSLTGLILNKLFADEDNHIKASDDDQKEIDCLAVDGLENLAGYICHRLHNSVEGIKVENIDDTYTWVNHLNEGGLSKPTSEMMAHMHQLQRVFDDINGDGLAAMANFIKEHIKKSEHIACDEKIKPLFFRARMFFRIRTLNKVISEEKKVENESTKK